MLESRRCSCRQAAPTGPTSAESWRSGRLEGRWPSESPGSTTLRRLLYVHKPSSIQADCSNPRTQMRTMFRRFLINVRCCRLLSTRSAWATTRSSTARFTTTMTFTTWPVTTTPRSRLWEWNRTFRLRIHPPPSLSWEPSTLLSK